MKYLILCAALAAAAPAMSQELVARQGSDSVRLADAPCKHAQVLGQLQQQVQGEYRAASATVSGSTFNACWRVVGNAAHIVYEDGDQGVIPLSELKPALSA